MAEKMAHVQVSAFLEYSIYRSHATLYLISLPGNQLLKVVFIASEPQHVRFCLVHTLMLLEYVQSKQNYSCVTISFPCQSQLTWE